MQVLGRSMPAEQPGARSRSDMSGDSMEVGGVGCTGRVGGGGQESRREQTALGLQAITMPLGFTLTEMGHFGELGAEASSLTSTLTGSLCLPSRE